MEIFSLIYCWFLHTYHWLPPDLGKSESFLYFASVMMKRHNLDYAMKLDADSILHLHSFLAFAQTNLPPYPYGKRIMAGAIRNKSPWPKEPSEEEFARKETYWRKDFEGVHNYLAGQCYMMSQDLVEWVVEEAPRSWNDYREGHEDHDVTSMAWKSPLPVTMITVGKTQRYWEHPVGNIVCLASHRITRTNKLTFSSSLYTSHIVGEGTTSMGTDCQKRNCSNEKATLWREDVKSVLIVY